MSFELRKTGLEEVKPLRARFLKENNFQFVHNKCHLYGWADTWLMTKEGQEMGYGSVWGSEKREARDTIFEFYLLPQFRDQSHWAYQELIKATGVNLLECQSNDRYHSALFFSYAREIRVDAILFEDDRPTSLPLGGLIFGKNVEEVTNPSDSGMYELKEGDQILARGGFLSNYNFPFSDIYMEVAEEHRGKGYASLIVQELKKEIYRQGRVPAARCNPANPASRSSLIRAGFRVCGALLTGKVGEKTP